MPRQALFDSNIIIDALNKHQPAFDAITELNQGATTLSRISWIEVMAGGEPEHRAATEAYLRGCTIVELTVDIAARAAEIRRQTRLKLPDAIVYATASLGNRRLVTRDKRFPSDWEDIVYPYVYEPKRD